MAFLSLFLLGISLLSVAIWFYSRWSEENAKVEYAKRNVKYVPQSNMLLLALQGKRLELVRHEIIQKEGKLMGFDFLGTRTVCVAEPEIAQLVLSKEFTNFISRRSNDIFLSNALGNVTGEQWKRLRAVVTPVFSVGSLRRMKPFLDDTVRTLLNNIELIKSSDNIVNMKHAYGSFTMDTVIQIAFGTKVDSLADKNNPIICQATKLFSVNMSLKNIVFFTTVFMAPRVANFLKLRFNGDVIDYFYGFAKQIISRKRQEFAKGQGLGKAYSLIELLLEAEIENEVQLVQSESNRNGNAPTVNGFGSKVPKYITNDELIAQCVMFIIAGYDTTASTIGLTAYLLALNPDVQEKLHQEIVTTLNKLAEEAGPDGPKDPVELVTIESLSRFEYLNAVLNESLRIYAPPVFNERQALKDVTLQTEDGRLRINVKKDDIVHFPIYSMHRDPEQFPEPDVFRPERFLGQPRHHKSSYMPFGSGPRNCVAKPLAQIEAKLAILHTIRQYKLSTCQETKIPPEFFNQGMALIPKDITLKVEKR